VRICFLSFEFPPYVIGGAGVYAENITKELLDLGHHVHVLSPGPVYRKNNSFLRKKFVHHQIPTIHRRFLNIPSFWFNLSRTYKKISKNVGGFDVLHGNDMSDFSLFSWQVDIPRVITIHHSAYQVAKNFSLIQRLSNITGETGLSPLIEKTVISRSDKIIAVSNYTKKSLISIYNILPSRIEVIPNGINVNDYAFAENEILEYKRLLGILNCFTFLFVGRLNDPRKNLLLVLNALKIICRKKFVKLILVGTGYNVKLSKMISSLGIEKNVIVLGSLDAVTLKKCYCACDALVSSSLLEGFGLVILEAMASAKPIVALNSGAVSELVRNGENGFLVENSDPHDLAVAMGFLLNHPNDVLRIGNRNKEWASNFSWTKSAEHLEKLYNSMIS
jgi:glycosyltransferase involved in cell wall biosynthesis